MNITRWNKSFCNHFMDREKKKIHGKKLIFKNKNKWLY